MKPIKRWDKDPDAVLDYAINWATWLDTDTISTSTWTVESGLTKDSDTKTTTIATIWVSGGTLATSYSGVNHIVTAAGREEDRTVMWDVKER